LNSRSVSEEEEIEIEIDPAKPAFLKGKREVPTSQKKMRRGGRRCKRKRWGDLKEKEAAETKSTKTGELMKKWHTYSFLRASEHPQRDTVKDTKRYLYSLLYWLKKRREQVDEVTLFDTGGLVARYAKFFRKAIEMIQRLLRLESSETMKLHWLKLFSLIEKKKELFSCFEVTISALVTEINNLFLGSPNGETQSPES